MALESREVGEGTGEVRKRKGGAGESHVTGVGEAKQKNYTHQSAVVWSCLVPSESLPHEGERGCGAERSVNFFCFWKPGGEGGQKDG